MIYGANQKSVLLLNSAAAATNATATANVDTRGFDFARIAVFASTTNAPSALKVEHSDTTDATNFSTINATGGTDFTIAGASSTSTNPLAVFDVSTVGLKRYLRLSVTPASATANIVAVCDLGQPAIGINDATDLSAAQYVTVPGR
jgi:hypothetical protein